MTNEAAAIAYHNATKHHYNRYARSLGYLDWATQPNPFRQFEGARRVPLPLLASDRSIPYESLYGPPSATPLPQSIDVFGLLFECSLAVSAWKQFQGERWALRCNPSSGNLHPTEGYLIAGPIPGLGETPGVYHYAPRDHALEARASFDNSVWSQIIEGFPSDVFFIGLSSIHWREAWKYGERAYRYCQHDVGHALAAVRFAAALIGRRAVLLAGLSDAAIAALLGLDRTQEFDVEEPEHPDLLLAVVPEGTNPPLSLSESGIRSAARGTWHGRANKLSQDRFAWPAIDNVAAACAKPGTAPDRWSPPAYSGLGPSPCVLSAYCIIQQRRSAVAMDAETAIPSSTFYRMLTRTMPSLGCAPWDVFADAPRVHLGLFVHRVSGLQPGIYCLARNADSVAALQRAMATDFVWLRPAGCPGDLPLYLLKACDCRRLATTVSCGQDIAGDGAFSVGMLAEFRASIERHGAWYYRRLFWEVGAIGQVLYLEAEAAGVRGTGIGCYFDDPVHEVFGLRQDEYQSMYHFTVGGPLEDSRLTTLPPYPPDRRAS